MNPLARTARPLFISALLIFVFTIVTGILNGLDVLELSRNTILTHVHAGTLGWITLGVVGAAMLMFGPGADDETVSRARTLANVTIVAAVLYVIAFFTTTGIFRPIAGTLMLVAIGLVLWWVARRYTQVEKTTSRLALLLAVISLTIGAILGVLLGLFIARGSVPGMSPATAASLGGAHPSAMLIGYLILAGVAVTDWLLEGPEGASGRIIAWILFVSGILVNVSFIAEVEALIQLSSLLEVVAIVWFIVRMWSRVRPSAWLAGDDNFARASVGFLGVGVALLAYVVQLFVSGQIDPEADPTGLGPLIAFDHAMFIGVMTNALFATVARAGRGAYNQLVMWAVNGGLVVFLVGLVADMTVLKRIGAPVMGLGLLYGIWLYLRSLDVRQLTTA